MSERLHIDLSVPPVEDCEEQLDLGDTRAFLELQNPEYLRTVGSRALQSAARLFDLANECQDLLVEWGEVPAVRRKKPDLLHAMPHLVEIQE